MTENHFDTIYPRPQLKKGYFQILHDSWTLNGRPIRLPYPPQSRLSGYEGELNDTLFYHTQCQLSEDIWKKLWNEEEAKKQGHVLLHFGAIDQIADVYIGGKKVAHHEGGYMPFTVDITAEIQSDTFELKIQVQDSLDQSFPYGKQSNNRGGMWYTPVSGIWQTVWCEWVPDIYMEKVRIHTHGAKADFEIWLSEETEEEATITLQTGSRQEVFQTMQHRLSVDLSKLTNEDGTSYAPVYWTPEHPHLYEVSITCLEDRAETYFGLRTVSIQEKGGYQRICINDEPVFLNGVLDQGYYEDGIFLPADPREYDRDICRMKELGFNMLRKHIKVEPELFYYACDRLGIYVLQDMVNNGPYHFVRDTLIPTIGFHHMRDIGRYQDEEQKQHFIQNAEETIDLLYDHPSVIGYTIFNEGWGQTDSDVIGDALRDRDPSRFYDYTSGWFTQKHSDVDSLHVYFRLKKLKAKKKPLLLSEFGGFSREVEGHTCHMDKSYGYGVCHTEQELTERIIRTYEKMVLPAIDRGLCGAVYTQLSDIEDEINGFYTYDREVCKVDKERIKALFARCRI